MCAQGYTTSAPGETLALVEYMRQDASVECGTAEHDSITRLAIGFVVIWPVGSLVLYSALLLACYKPLQAKSPNALTKATAFLHREYKRNWYWWEAADLARKLFLTGFVLLVAEEEDSFVRLVVAVLVCSCYAVAIALVQPYKRFEDNILAVVPLRPIPHALCACLCCSSQHTLGSPWPVHHPPHTRPSHCSHSEPNGRGSHCRPPASSSSSSSSVPAGPPSSSTSSCDSPGTSRGSRPPPSSASGLRMDW